MKNQIIPAASTELASASAKEISAITCDVVGLDHDLRQNNTELSLLNEAIESLDRTLRMNKALKSTVRSSMQKVITKL